VPGYCASLIARFANPALGHRTRQIAIDGSQKLPLRLLPSLRARIARGESFELLAFAIAAWIRFLEGRTEAGEAYAIDDPLRARLDRTIARSGPDALSTVTALLGLEAVFGSDLAQNPQVGASIAAHLSALRALGSVGAARSAIAR
jgi:fructuronate reductase